jgi:hypothetical protein
MKKRITYPVILVLLLSIVFSACEDVVEVDLNPEDIDLYAVEAYLTTKASNNVYVKIEKSVPVDKTISNPVVNNALVLLSDDLEAPNTIILEEIGQSGIYMLPDNSRYNVVPGRTYKIKITTPEGSILTASEKLAPVEQLDKVKINLSARGDFQFLAIFINSQETPGVGDYYLWNIYKNGYLVNDITRTPFASDELVDGNYIYDFEIYTDFYNEDDENDKPLMEIGDVMHVEQLSISKVMYDYLLRMTDQAFAGGPFSVPPANPVGNFTSNDGKKVLGIFSVSDVSVGNSIVIDSTNYTPLISSMENSY